MTLAAVEDWEKYTAAPQPGNAPELLAAASQAVVTYCGWPIVRQVVTGQVFDADGSWLLRLPTLLLASVEAVRVDDVEVTNYLWSADGVLDRRPFCWPEGYRRVTVSYTHGYATVPADITALVVACAARAAAMTPGLKSETVGGIQEVYADPSNTGLAVFDKVALDRYRLFR